MTEERVTASGDSEKRQPWWPTTVSSTLIVFSIAAYAWALSYPMTALPHSLLLAMPLLSLAAVVLADRGSGPKALRLLLGAIGILLTLLWVMFWLALAPNA